jgi:hypothetical protein
MATNWNCCGSGPHVAGEVRVYPLGGGANLILCAACWCRENQYRIERQSQRLPRKIDENDFDWPLHNWRKAEVYST